MLEQYRKGNAPEITVITYNMPSEDLETKFIGILFAVVVTPKNPGVP